MTKEKISVNDHQMMLSWNILVLYPLHCLTIISLLCLKGNT